MHTSFIQWHVAFCSTLVLATSYTLWCGLSKSCSTLTRKKSVWHSNHTLLLAEPNEELLYTRETMAWTSREPFIIQASGEINLFPAGGPLAFIVTDVSGPPFRSRGREMRVFSSLSCHIGTYTVREHPPRRTRLPRLLRLSSWIKMRPICHIVARLDRQRTAICKKTCCLFVNIFGVTFLQQHWLSSAEQQTSREVQLS